MLIYTEGIKSEHVYDLQNLVHTALQEQMTPGLAFMVFDLKQRKSLALYAGQSQRQDGFGIDQESYYDLASLSKPFVTALWAWELIEQGVLEAQAPLHHYLNTHNTPLAQVGVIDLLRHSSGLPAHYTYYEDFAFQRMQGQTPSTFQPLVQDMILTTPLSYEPGSRSIYSDLGYLLLAWICEKVSQKSLLEYANDRLSQLSQLDEWSWMPHLSTTCHMHFNPLEIESQTIINQRAYVPTENCPWRKKLIQGEVHDDNAWLLGGVTGHAGLFARLNDVALWSCHWIHAWHNRTHCFPLSHQMVQQVCDLSLAAPDSSYTWGWDTPSRYGYSSAGQSFGSCSVGHLGFTGTSIWMDLTAEVSMILLSNRVYPHRNFSNKIRDFRPMIHDMAWKILHT